MYLCFDLRGYSQNLFEHNLLNQNIHEYLSFKLIQFAIRLKVKHKVFEKSAKIE